MADFSKVGKKSRSKGSRYELKIAKLLSAWTSFQITRVPMSGGWNKTGDLTPKKPEDMVKFIFSFELKNREKWDFKNLITGKNSGTEILNWWEQCVEDSKIGEKIPILVFTRSLDIDYCCLDQDMFRHVRSLKDGIQHIEFGYLNFFKLSDLLEIDYNKLVEKING